MNRITFYIAFIIALVMQAQLNRAQQPKAEKLNTSIEEQRKINGFVHDEDGKGLIGATVQIKGQSGGTATDLDGKFSIDAKNNDTLVFNYIGYLVKEIQVGKRTNFIAEMKPGGESIKHIVTGYGTLYEQMDAEYAIPSRAYSVKNSSPVYSHSNSKNKIRGTPCFIAGPNPHSLNHPQSNTESYASLKENGFKNAAQTPLSTLSIDVDAASYSNVRRFLKDGNRPPVEAVRVEEMINYFDYSYPAPTDEHPFAIYTEAGPCPWNKNNQLLHVGIQGEKIETENLPASNLVFLIDVSGSMNGHNKLPLLKKSFKLLVKKLRKEDRVAMVVYAGNSGLVLESTNGDQKEKIIGALDRLNAGGSTAGAAGLELAYKVALDHFVDGGNNRIILATDGDFNVGPRSNHEMENIIEDHRKKGIFISVLGFGMGNYKDDKMEIIADKGNGNYAYIDNILEAKKVLVNEFGGTLFTIAKDVKIQIEFNPNHVKEYRLIGYENRLLNNEDFEDDTKDAGELGSGHTVTAIYELVMVNKGVEEKLRYHEPTKNNGLNTEMATVKFRYKKPEGQKSILMEKHIDYNILELASLSNNYKFSASVAGFGMILSKSKYTKDYEFKSILDWATGSKGNDTNGYRSEFIELVKLAEEL